MNLTSRNQDPMHASLALSSLSSVWYKPNSLNNKSIYNTLLLEFYIWAKLKLTQLYQNPKKKCHYFCTGVYWRCNSCGIIVPWTSCQIHKIMGCTCAGNTGNVFPATAGYRSRNASRHVRDACAVMHAGIANQRFPLKSVAGKTFPAFLAHVQPAILRIG